MPQLLHPGVYIQEVPSTTRAIEGASTSVASFIGLADRGPIYKAVSVSSFSDYQAKFCWNNGGFRADSYLSYAVRAFFDNGGKKCYIVRVTKTDDQKKSTGSVGSLTFEDYTATTIGKEDAFDWNKVTDGENGATTDSESIKLLDFLIDDLGLPIDKTAATTIAKQSAADGTETITVSKGTDSVTLKLAKDKSKATLRKLDGTSIDYVVKAGAGTAINVSLPEIMHSFTIKAGIFYKDDKGSDQYGEEGNWGSDLYLEIENGRTNPESEFSIIVKKSDNTVLETLDDLSIIKGTNNYVKEAINKGSRYICIDTSGSREVESAGFMVSGAFDNDSVDLSGNGNKDYTTDRKFEIKIDDSEFIPININESQDRRLLHLYITPQRGFDWNKVTDGENGATTDSESIKLLDFLIDDLGLPIDKTAATTIAKQSAADGTETITVSKGTDSVTLKLDAKKTSVNLTRGVNIIAYTAADIGGGKLIVYVNTRFDWNKVTDGENGATTDSESIKLLDFLIDDLGLPIDKTAATTIAKQSAADGTETITVSKGTDSVTLKLDAKKSDVSITSTSPITNIPKIDTTLAADLTFVANKIQEKVNAAAHDPRQPHSASDALGDFKCTYNVDSFHRLYLKSGTYDNVTNTGETYSSITIRPASGDRLSKNMVENLKLSITSNAMHGSRIFSPRLGIYKIGKGSIPPLVNDYTLTSEGTDAEYQHLQPIDFTDALSSLDTKDDVSIITIPGNGGPILSEDASDELISTGINYCRDPNHRPLADCIFIADIPKSANTVDGVLEFVSNLATKNDYGVLYFPWVESPDPIGKGRNPTILLPPSGHMAGVYASIDSKRAVWEAPAGTKANVANALGLKLDLKDVDQDQLNPKSINAIRSFSGPGIVVWGARTLSSDIALRYIPVRRMINFLKVSIYNGIQWAVFESNDEPLWASLRLNIGAFMMDLFRQGAFQGSTPSEAFFVKCDKDTNPQINIDRGIVTVLVGFAPLKPAEFVLVKISYDMGQTG